MVPKNPMRVPFLVFILVLLLAILANLKAKAEYLYIMSAFVCDTNEQALSIIETHQKNGFEAGRSAYLALREARNEENEPKCDYLKDVGVVEIVGTVWKGKLEFPSGTQEMIILEVLTRYGKASIIINKIVPLGRDT